MCIILHRRDFCILLCSKCKVKRDQWRQNDFNI